MVGASTLCPLNDLLRSTIPRGRVVVPQRRANPDDDRVAAPSTTNIEVPIGLAVFPQENVCQLSRHKQVRKVSSRCTQYETWDAIQGSLNATKIRGALRAARKMRDPDEAPPLVIISGQNISYLSS
jgi:hypothetical protein